MKKEVTLFENDTEVAQSVTELINAVVRSRVGDINFLQGFHAGKTVKYKEPAEKRLNKSKFAKIISEMSDEELKALAYCMLVSKKTMEAIKCYNHTVDKTISMIALEVEYKKRKAGMK